MAILRANSKIRNLLGNAGVSLLEKSGAAFDRVLPHIELEKWQEGPPGDSAVVWDSPSRRAIRIVIGIGAEEDGRSVMTVARRRPVPRRISDAPATLDLQEHAICSQLLRLIDQALFQAVTYEAE